MWRLRSVVALVGLSCCACDACGVPKSDGDAGGAGSTSSHGSSESATSDATVGASNGATSGSGDASDAGDASSSGSSSSSGATEPPPFPGACEEPEATIVVGAAITPEGPMQIDEAWFGIDYCGELPYVVLVQAPSRENGPGLEAMIRVDADGLPTDPLLGTYVARTWDAQGTIEFLEPLDGYEVGVPNPENRLHAQIEIHESGWDLSVEVELLDCGVAECLCPCE
jgi:hypothetical protein